MSIPMRNNDHTNTKIMVDFHVHTHYSSDSLTTPKKLIEKLGKVVNRIVVTDHNTIKGALEAKAIDPDRVIIGEEIMTSKGEILAVFVKEEIQSGLEPMEAINMLREQNALISISHPFDVFRNGSWKIEDLMPIMEYIDAIEGFNARVLNRKTNLAAIKFANDHNKLITAGSDAHTFFEIGRAGILLQSFSGVDELRKNLKHGVVIEKKSPWWVHLFSTYAKRRKNR